MAGRLRRVAGQRHVDAVLGQPAVELGAPRAPRCAAPAAPRAPGAPRSPACRPARAAPAAARRSSAASAVSSDLRPEVAHPQLLELGRGARGAAIAASASLRSCVRGQPWAAILFAALVEGDGRRHRHVERVVAHRDAARLSASSSAGSPARSAPRQSTSGGRELGLARASALAVRAQRQRRPGSSSRPRRAPAGARTPSPCWRAPPSARTGRRSPGRGSPGRRPARARSG